MCYVYNLNFYFFPLQNIIYLNKFIIYKRWCYLLQFFFFGFLYLQEFFNQFNFLFLFSLLCFVLFFFIVITVCAFITNSCCENYSKIIIQRRNKEINAVKKWFFIHKTKRNDIIKYILIHVNGCYHMNINKI